MLYKSFLYTRTLRDDYCWHIRPNLMPPSFYRYMTRFIQLRESLDERADIAWDKTLFFIKYDALNIVCRILENGFDYVGRAIYSLEGFVSENTGMRSRLSMADVVKYFLTHPESFSVLEDSGELFESLELDEEINPLLPYETIAGIDNELDCDGFRKLVTAISEEKEDYDFVISPDADIIYPFVGALEQSGNKMIKHFYSLNQGDSSETNNDKKPEPGNCVACEHSDSKKDNGISISIRISREGRVGGSYQWYVRRNTDGACKKSIKRCFEDGISLSRMITEERKIRTYYSLLGYNIVE